MSGFHACCISMPILGKRFHSAVHRDIIIEITLGGSNSTENVLKCKHYNRGMLVMKTIYEAFVRPRLEVFEQWMTDNGNSKVFIDFMESAQLCNINERRITSLHCNILPNWWLLSTPQQHTTYANLVPCLWSSKLIGISLTVGLNKWIYTELVHKYIIWQFQYDSLD